MTTPSAPRADGVARVGQGRRPVARRPWPRLPRWLWVAVGTSFIAFVGLVGYTVARVIDPPTQPLFERRSAPRADASHDIGGVVVSPATPTDVQCGAVRGLKVAGDLETAPLLADALRGFCTRLLALDPRLGDRVVVAARRGTVISFGVFERTGDDSTTLRSPGEAPRVAINTRFAGIFKGYLLPLLAHELWHAGAPAAGGALEELAARRLEAAMCRAEPSTLAGRSCEDAVEIVRVPEADALRLLRAAGFP